MISGLLDVSMTPKTNIAYLLRPQVTSNDQRKPTSCLENLIVGNFNVLVIEHFESFGNDGNRQTLKIRLISF